MESHSIGNPGEGPDLHERQGDTVWKGREEGCTAIGNCLHPSVHACLQARRGQSIPCEPPPHTHSQKPFDIHCGPGLLSCRKLLTGLTWTGHLSLSPYVARSCLLGLCGPGVSSRGKLLASPWRNRPAGGGSKLPQLFLTPEVGMAYHHWGYLNKNHLQPQSLQRASQRRTL